MNHYHCSRYGLVTLGNETHLLSTQIIFFSLFSSLFVEEKKDKNDSTFEEEK